MNTQQKKDKSSKNVVNFKQIQKDREGKIADELEADMQKKIKFSKLHAKQILLTLFLLSCIIAVNQIQITHIADTRVQVVTMVIGLNIVLAVCLWQVIMNKFQEHLEIGKFDIDLSNATAVSNQYVTQNQQSQVGVYSHSTTCNLEDIDSISLIKQGSEKPFLYSLFMKSDKWSAVVEESHDKVKMENEYNKIMRFLQKQPSLFSHQRDKMENQI